jgi:hypothetical protein
MKSGNLNFLKFSGPLQACNGSALPALYHRKEAQIIMYVGGGRGRGGGGGKFAGASASKAICFLLMTTKIFKL